MRHTILPSVPPAMLGLIIRAARAGDVIEVTTMVRARHAHKIAREVHGEAHGIIVEIDGKVVEYSDEEGKA